MKAVAIGGDLASISRLDLADHDPEGRAGYVTAIEEDVDKVKAVLTRQETNSKFTCDTQEGTYLIVLVRNQGFRIRMIYLDYISCLRYTILVRNI